MKAAFKSFYMISYDLYLGIMISFQQVCEMGSFLVLAAAFSKVTVSFCVSISMLEEPLVNFKKPSKTSGLASFMYLLNHAFMLSSALPENIVYSSTS